MLECVWQLSNSGNFKFRPGEKKIVIGAALVGHGKAAEWRERANRRSFMPPSLLGLGCRLGLRGGTLRRMTTGTVQHVHQPYLTGLYDGTPATEAHKEQDWTYDTVHQHLTETQKLAAAPSLEKPLRVLVLYGSLRERSFSRLFAFEAARLLHHLGCQVAVYNPRNLPLKDDESDAHPKVQELRELVKWSQAHFWCSPEQHGNLTGIFKLQIDHVPLSLGSVRPTQGKFLAVSQVNGGSQSFNTVNSLRVLGRWMRMFTIPNQASLPKAWTQFTPPGPDGSGNRLMESSNRDRLVDVVEELVKTAVLFQNKEELMSSRYSERKEKLQHSRLLSQAEKEALKS